MRMSVCQFIAFYFIFHINNTCVLVQAVILLFVYNAYTIYLVELHINACL